MNGSELQGHATAIITQGTERIKVAVQANLGFEALASISLVGTWDTCEAHIVVARQAISTFGVTGVTDRTDVTMPAVRDLLNLHRM